MSIELNKSNIKIGSLIFRNDGYACYVLGSLDNVNFIFMRNSWDNKLVYGFLRLDILNDNLVSDFDKEEKYKISAIIEKPSPDFIACSLRSRFADVQKFLSCSEELKYDNNNQHTDDRKHLIKGNICLDRNGGVHLILGLHEGKMHTLNTNLISSVFLLENFKPNLHSKINMRLGIKCVFSGIDAISALFNPSHYRITNNMINQNSLGKFKVFDNRTKKDLGQWKPR